jgi:dynamin 1-like protein
LRLVANLIICCHSGTSGTTFTSEDNLPLSAGARIYDIFHRSFGREVEAIHALAGLDDNTILEEIYNAAGPRPSLFVPESAFEAVAKRQIRKLEAPSTFMCVGGCCC